MPEFLEKIHVLIAPAYLHLFLGLAIYLFTLGIRHIISKNSNLAVYLLAALSMGTIHALLLLNPQVSFTPRPFLGHFQFADWLSYLLIPTFICLFVVSGVLEFIRVDFKMALYKLFFGLTLYCYFYELDINWTIPDKTAMMTVWLIFWFYLEITPRDEIERMYLRKPKLAFKFFGISYNRRPYRISPDIYSRPTSIEKPVNRPY